MTKKQQKKPNLQPKKAGKMRNTDGGKPMRRPRHMTQGDYTDQHLRRAAQVLGYKGKNRPLGIADVLVHANRPGEDTLLQLNGETCRKAADRLRGWAFGGDR